MIISYTTLIGVKNLLKFYLCRIIDLDTVHIKSYHMHCHNRLAEYRIQALEHSLDFVTGVT